MATVMSSTGGGSQYAATANEGLKRQIQACAVSAGNAVEATVNAAERETGVDIDRDGDIGVPGRSNALAPPLGRD